DMLLYDLGAFLNCATLIVLPHAAEQLGIAAPVAEHVVAALLDLLDDVRILVAHGGVEKYRRRQLELVENLEQSPGADAVAVVGPGKIARRRRAAAIGRVHSQAGAEGEMLDVQRDVEGEPLAAGPIVIRPLLDGHVIVTGMAGQLEHAWS